MRKKERKTAKKAERKSRWSLTLLLAAVIMVFLVVTLVAAVLGAFLLVKFGVIEIVGDYDSSFLNTLFLLSVNSLVLGFALSTLASRYPLRPVNKIITQLNRLASGDFKARLHFKEPWENIPSVKETCDSFNAMAEELEATEMLRSDFINNFSHEFKTPIVSITGFAKLLKHGNLSEEQRREYIDIIEAESLRLTTLATNILNLTKYENQSILTEVTEYNLSEQLRSCILTLEGKWVRKNIDFDLDFDEYKISANQDMLKHIWLNLLDNAIKFSPEGESVAVKISSGTEHYEVVIRNRGQELTPEQQGRIFHRFYQVDESHATEGNGIGLALVKGIVQLHKGSVSVCCADGYVAFTVTLPKIQCTAVKQ